ncbi:beta strand repeat-containing protein [Aquimarina sp. 2201CG5-10]|uniref:beta strand repeat-containing protein n=1 Tax=Aquimarina callyspongiae TaxID=3098150 RepID=UPI002AB4AFF1|nr:Calx-beta domain-containing protein [Aquimarina sp. 2201CG5-10]MDY8138780.1 Calx-beta domain-containing protein [Aquimarina sp. 2201CG5-10]
MKNPRFLTYRILFLFVFIPLPFINAQDTYSDTFSTVAYNNSDGNQAWTTSWIESGDDGTPFGGRIFVSGFNDLEIFNMDGRSISRTIDLSAYSSVTLSVQYFLIAGNEVVDIDLFNNTTGLWETVLTTGNGFGTTLTHTLTASQISSGSAIRFISGSGNWQNFETVAMDNVLFTGTIANPQLSISDVTVNENAGTANLTVSHTGSSTSGSFTVEYSTANNTATQPGDYTATGAPAPTITFSGTSPENQTLTVPISIIDDNFAEPTESFFVNLANVSDPSVTITDGQGEITITDDDNASIAINDITVNEADGTATLTVTLSGASVSGGFTLPFTFANGSATDPADYTAAGATGSPLTFTGTINETQQITIPIVDDTDVEADHNFFINLGTPSNTIVTVSDNQGEVTIQDNDSAITIDDVSVNEAIGTMTFTVSHTGSNAAGSFTVNFATADNSALNGPDYVATTGTLSFSGTAPETRTITVSIVVDALAEPTETFFVNLSGISDPSVVITDAQGIGTITDVIPVNQPLTLFDEFNGRYDYALTGGTLRDSDANTCSITTSSSNTLTTTIPGTATIERALLFWAHSGATPDVNVTFEGQAITANIVNQATFGTQPYFGMVSDVTTLIQGIANPSTNTYDFSGLTVDNTNNTFFYCGGNTTLGGWSLMIFYEELSLPAVSINLYNGFDGEQNATTNYTLSGFFAIGSVGSKTSILSWEGDPGTDNNEILSLTTGSGTNILNGDGDNDGTPNNPFNSTIFDNTVAPIVNNVNGRGIDLDTYDISSFIAQGESTATTNIQVGGDFVILNAVVLKVPSNLMTGTVFEDINYPGGAGRDLVTSSGAGVQGVTVELYNNSGVLEDSDVTDINGQYNIGGMANGDYSLRVVNNTINSTRGGGSTCVSCLPVQTFRKNFSSSTLSNVTNEIGGANPSAEDVAAGILTGAQTISSVSILAEGAVDLDFGFNFNTIVNTNSDGQGSLGQFIINANALDETGLDIEANSIFNPAAGEDTSIFMIPPTGDPLGRTADTNFGSGFFDINLPNSTPLNAITGDATHIDGRTQTAYSGDTNIGTVGSGGTTVGTSATTLPNYNLPEIQVRSDFGDVLQLQASNVVLRNLAVYGGNRRAIRQDSGTDNLITQNLMGVNALGVVGTVGVGGYVDDGFEINGGGVTLDGNYIASNTDFGISINGGTSTIIQNNQISNNGFRNCEYNIRAVNGSGIVIQNNLIDGSAALGIFDDQGNITITENTITTAGSDNSCTETSGVLLNNSNTSVTNNIINNNGGSGINLTGGNTSGNLISQNSIFANGTITPSLGIDINNDGVTINDNGDIDNGPNGSTNFPVFETATISGTSLRVVGWARPGATIEFFVTDISQGTATAGDNQLGLSQDYGEGQIYLGSAIEGSASDGDATVSNYIDADGNTDNTNRFDFSITLPSRIPVGSIITTTATISNSTSEFGNSFSLRAATVITNRKITYRVNRN